MKTIPKLRLTTVQPTCRIVAGTHIQHGLHRFQAEVSSMREGWQESLTQALGGDVRLGVLLHRAPGAHINGRYVLDGWCKASSMQHVVEEDELASTVQQMGLVQTARNMYMDSDDIVWRIRREDGKIVITKDTDADDISSLLEQASTLNGLPSDGGFASPLDVINLPAKVLYADSEGCLQSGIVHSMLPGTPSFASCLSVKNRKMEKTPIVLHPLQVVIAEHWEGMKAGNDIATLRQYGTEIASIESNRMFESLYVALQPSLTLDGTESMDTTAERTVAMSPDMPKTKKTHIDWKLGDRMILKHPDDSTKNMYCLATVVGVGSQIQIVRDDSAAIEKLSRRSKLILGKATSSPVSPMASNKKMSKMTEQVAMSMLESEKASPPQARESTYVVAVHTRDDGAHLAFRAAHQDMATIQHFQSADRTGRYVLTDSALWTKLPLYATGQTSMTCDVLSDQDLKLLAEDAILQAKMDGSNTALTWTREIS